jgi:hypothetical protein
MRATAKMRVTYPGHLPYNSSNHPDPAIRSKLPTHRPTPLYPSAELPQLPNASTRSTSPLSVNRLLPPSLA